MATHQITLPGVYMDAVNPDYLVVRILNPHPEPIVTWLINGNYLSGKFPFLISLYHGSQQVWLGLPLFWLFGTTVTGLRLTHATFALGVLAAMYVVLGRGGMRPWQAALACAALAVDPAFSYAFRTQSYITLAPSAWLFLSLYSLQRTAAPGAATWRWLVASGAFLGLATVGYFIYAFFLPAMLVAVRLWAQRTDAFAGRESMRAWFWPWLAGLALGGSFYVIGYALVFVQAGGLEQGWLLFQQWQGQLDPLGGQISLRERIFHAWTLIGVVFQNSFHHALIFDELAPLPGAMAKTGLLAAGPVVLWVGAEMQRKATPLLRTLIALPCSFVAVGLVFGSRLAGHHFVPLLPLAYAALAVALSVVASRMAWSRKWAAGAFVVVFAALAFLNSVGQARESERLAQTHGVGLYSDAINQFAADLTAMQRKPFVYFPDWGLAMPVAFLTRGTIGMDSVEDFARARRMLCDGRDVAVALISGDRAARIDAWRRELQWGAPSITPYRQFDGKVVFELALFRGARDAAACVAAAR